MDYKTIERIVRACGLSLGGAFHPHEGDGAPEATGTIILIPGDGRAWEAFRADPEFRDGKPDPLDRWSARRIGALAEALGAQALFPFSTDGHPFSAWGQKAEPCFVSPLGMLIHAEKGLWRSWRGALGFKERIALPPRSFARHPCESCEGKPCLNACPVGAFARDKPYDAAGCVSWAASPDGQACAEEGCLVRRVCPIGHRSVHGRERAAFHMRAFLGERGAGGG